MRRMDMLLREPENKLCVQEEVSKNKEKDRIVFISKGRCDIIVNDRFEKRIESKVIG